MTTTVSVVSLLSVLWLFCSCSAEKVRNFDNYNKSVQRTEYIYTIATIIVKFIENSAYYYFREF